MKKVVVWNRMYAEVLRLGSLMNHNNSAAYYFQQYIIMRRPVTMLKGV